jgi:hypothetical protein
VSPRVVWQLPYRGQLRRPAHVQELLHRILSAYSPPAVREAVDSEV